MSKALKGIFFDMDGVIIDSDPLWNYIIATVMTKYHLNADVLDETDGYNLSTEMAIKMILEHSNRYTPELFSEILTTIDRLYAENHKSMTSLIEPMAEVLQQLKEKNKRLILVSNSSRRQVDRILEHYQLAHYFDSCVTSDDVANGKPDKAPYLEALRRSGLKKEEVIVVEDSLTGITAAKNAGLNYIVVSKSRIPNEHPIPHSMLLTHLNASTC